MLGKFQIGTGVWTANLQDRHSRRAIGKSFEW